MSRPPVVVLGAGCAGLAAARRLRARGLPVLLVEAADRVGGLAGGIPFDGDVYEYGPHIFHTTDERIMADVKALMGAELLPYERTIQIKFLGNYFQFPLSIPDVLTKLPLTTTAHAGLSFLFHFTKGLFVRPEAENSETVLRRYYGDVLYRLFFKDYIERVWGISPAGFSPAFARERIPRFDILELPAKAAAALRKRLTRPARSAAGFVEKVEGDLWTTKKGFSLICERMAEDFAANGGELRLDTRAQRIHTEGNRIVAVELESGGKTERLVCSGLINTLAINDAVGMMSPAPDHNALEAAAALRFRAIVFVGLKIRRPKVLRASFMYFREHSFNRITDLAHFDFEMRPAGTTLLVAEITCDPGDRLWKDEPAAVEAVTEDLVREGIIERAEIVSAHVFRARHGYPVYSLGYEKNLEVLLDVFEGLENARSAGRQGRFQYVNTHVAMRMGIDAADELA